MDRSAALAAWAGAAVATSAAAAQRPAFLALERQAHGPVWLQPALKKGRGTACSELAAAARPVVRVVRALRIMAADMAEKLGVLARRLSSIVELAWACDGAYLKKVPTLQPTTTSEVNWGTSERNKPTPAAAQGAQCAHDRLLLSRRSNSFMQEGTCQHEGPYLLLTLDFMQNVVPKCIWAVIT